MTTGAIIMMIIGLGLTWGGATICIGIALRARKGRQDLSR